ncbi:MAG: peptide-methionine (S)-S-oxide reductase MsrA [Verrucomicrobia bacterium]|nr:peptide-methionine (S)-S-oxide reductase MsrA [Verrucomicrobiota bacterium]
MKPNIRLTIGLLLGAAAQILAPNMNAAEPDQPKPTTELATFGGGCFWCTEAVFERLDGVKAVTSGYAGGPKANPTYKEVCEGDTGHAEVIQIEFDPAKISFEKLLDLFWDAHDPTTLNRQGADSGTQYRSVIFFHSEAQKTAAEKSKRAAAARFRDPIVTEIAPLTKFYKAEAYHQDYFRNNSNAPYCRVVIRPKIEKLDKRQKKP